MIWETTHIWYALVQMYHFFVSESMLTIFWFFSLSQVRHAGMTTERSDLLRLDVQLTKRCIASLLHFKCLNNVFIQENRGGLRRAKRKLSLPRLLWSPVWNRSLSVQRQRIKRRRRSECRLLTLVRQWVLTATMIFWMASEQYKPSNLSYKTSLWPCDDELT